MPPVTIRKFVAVLVAVYGLLLGAVYVSVRIGDLAFVVLSVGLGVALVVLWVPGFKAVKQGLTGGPAPAG